MFPGIVPRVLTLNINFMAPFLREYLLLHGVCTFHSFLLRKWLRLVANRFSDQNSQCFVPAGSVDKLAIINLLNNGHSVLVVVGGGSESLLSLPGRYDLVLNRRKGFVRVALETGCSLVPVIGYGETESYRTINQLPHDSWLRRWQRKIEKTLGFTVPICIGVGLFMPFGILPYPVPLNIVIGKPIDVPRYTGVYCCADG